MYNKKIVQVMAYIPTITDPFSWTYVYFICRKIWHDSLHFLRCAILCSKFAAFFDSIIIFAFYNSFQNFKACTNVQNNLVNINQITFFYLLKKAYLKLSLQGANLDVSSTRRHQISGSNLITFSFGISTLKPFMQQISQL